MENLKENLKILDQKIDRLIQQKEEINSIYQKRVELVEELSDRVNGNRLFICIKMRSRSFTVIPAGFFCDGINNGKRFLLQDAIDFARTENCFSNLLSAFLEGKTEMEVRVAKGE